MKILLLSDMHRGRTENTHLIHNKLLNKVAKLDFDVIVLAGDNASTKQGEIESLFKAIRAAIPLKPVYAVRGNHDYWDMDCKTPLGMKIANWNAMCTKYSITSLDGQMVDIDGVKVYGWHNWYGTSRHIRGTNDEYHLEIEEDLRLYKDDMDSFWRYIDAGVKADILINHMPIFPRPGYDIWGGILHQWEALKENNMLPRVYLYGHTHQKDDTVRDGVRCCMTGSDYDRPEYMIVEVLE